jgi:glycosyltransferase involved in cell wall biosynthesis
VRLLFSASLEDRRKRADLAVAAFALLLDRHPDGRLVMSGVGDPSWALAGIPARVRDAVDIVGAGRPEEVPGRYRDATVTVLSAQHEAFGLVLLESLASGTPAVCLPSGGAPEVLGSDRVGHVASSCTAEALAEAVEHAVALARRDGTASHCVARALQWDWGVTVGPAHERVYAELVGAAAYPGASAPVGSDLASRATALAVRDTAGAGVVTRRRQLARNR